MAIRNFLVALKLFLNAKCSLSLWSKWQIGHGKWFLNTNLFLTKPFLITKFDCILEIGEWWLVIYFLCRKNDGSSINPISATSFSINQSCIFFLIALIRWNKTENAFKVSKNLSVFVHAHYGRFGVFLFKINMQVKTV